MEGYKEDNRGEQKDETTSFMQMLKTIIFLLIANASLGQQVSYEQIAFDYFTSTIISEEFDAKDKFEIIVNISDDRSGSVYMSCFEDYYRDFKSLTTEQTDEIKNQRELYYSTRDSIGTLGNIPSSFKIWKKSSSSKRRKTIEVNIADTYSPNLFFVEITVYLKDGQNRYSIEIDSNDNSVSRWCKQSINY